MSARAAKNVGCDLGLAHPIDLGYRPAGRLACANLIDSGGHDLGALASTDYWIASRAKVETVAAV